MCFSLFLFNDTATNEIYTYLHTLSLHDARPIWLLLVQDSGTWCEFGPTDPRDLPTDEPGDDPRDADAPDGDDPRDADRPDGDDPRDADTPGRSEEHTSELQSLMRISYAVFCLKQKTTHSNKATTKKIAPN